MVVHHQDSVSCFYGGVIHFIDDSDDELCLPESHGGVESSGVHSEGIEVVSISNMPIHSNSSFNSCIF